MSLEERITTLEDRREIEELKHLYGYYIDKKRWDDLFALFTEDVRLEFSWEGMDSYEGRDSLEEYVESIESQRDFMSHMFHNPVIDIDGDEAQGQWYFEAVLTDHDGNALWSQGRYDDVYRRVDGEWKIHRVVTTYHYSTTYEGGWSNEVLVS
ncbi:MAG: nuclear transport factor 2 family protein [Halovenus sp.]